ncbi:hypothetical protein GQ600_10336 [Phytophthora cactorum]|nr:hypothetical protein GQ600_10336 [Phytophthora cactorum]
MAEDIKPTYALASPQPGTKRKKVSRTALTVREKAIVKSFCEQKVTDCKARGELVPSQEVLRGGVATQFGWSCGRSTLSKIISMDWKLLRSSHEGGEAPRNPNMKRRRRPLFRHLRLIWSSLSSLMSVRRAAQRVLQSNPVS